MRPTGEPDAALRLDPPWLGAGPPDPVKGVLEDGGGPGDFLMKIRKQKLQSAMTPEKSCNGQSLAECTEQGIL